MFALFKDGKQASKAHSTKDAVAVEAYEMGLVVDWGADFPGDKPGRGMIDNYKIKKVDKEEVVIRRNITWTDIGGGVTSIGGEYHFESEDDEHYVREIWSAMELGWTPRKWWKLWRLDDSPNPPDHILKRALATKEPTQ